jgi:hypothetical protein
MYDAIRAVGPEHVTLSSDAGEPLFPNTVECIRLIRGYMRAFGLTEEEIHMVSEINPARVIGALPRAATPSASMYSAAASAPEGD